jgi:hypothetical protein
MLLSFLDDKERQFPELEEKSWRVARYRLQRSEFLA